MKRTLIVLSAVLLSLFVASGQTHPRFEIGSQYSLVHSNFGLMWLARAGGAVHVSNDWALNVEFGEGASAIPFRSDDRDCHGQSPATIRLLSILVHDRPKDMGGVYL